MTPNHIPATSAHSAVPPQLRADPEPTRAPSHTEQIHASLFSNYDGQKR
ncbi:hypothetical protein AB4Z09_18140 [Rhodococcus sp. TAF43]